MNDDSITYVAELVKKVEVIGFNMSIIQITGGYLGLIRNLIFPEKKNIIYVVKLDKNFDVILQEELKDITGRKLHDSWTSGLEDPRILSDKAFLAVTCDTNPNWKPEMSYVEMDLSNNTITRVQPMSRCGQTHQPQKNWLFIRKESDTYIDVLYESEPFCVIRVDIKSGYGFYLKEHNMLSKYKETRINNGAIMELPDGYLLVVRLKEKDGTWYHCSRWIKLDKEYNVVGVSPMFRFMNEFEGVKYMNDDGTIGIGGFEICMSIHQEGECVVACTSIDDRCPYIFKYKLQDILSSLK
jgi:hypothetical protein